MYVFIIYYDDHSIKVTADVLELGQIWLHYITLYSFFAKYYNSHTLEITGRALQ